MTFTNIVDALRTCNSAAVMSHVMPDGDSVGSILALSSILKRMGKSVEVYSGDIVPGVYSFLPGYDSILNCDSYNGRTYDIAVVLDCGSPDRCGKCSAVIGKSHICINIDHHVTNSGFGNLNYVDTNASSTGEILYRIIRDSGIDITKDEAICLYTAILTDTGRFKYSNTTALTHRIAGELIDSGFDFGSIHDYIYNNYEYNNVKALGKAIAGIQLFCGGRVAYMQLLEDDLDHCDMHDIDTNDFINFARDIRTVEAAAFVKQVNSGEYKVSLRSKNYVDVRAICEKHGGGGHIKAAGCTINGSLKSVKDIILGELMEALKGDNN